MAAPIPAWPRGDPRDVARAIVADPRFTVHPIVAPARRGWWDDVRDWILHLLRMIFHRLDRALGSGNAFDTIIGFLILIAAFALAGYCVFLFVRSYGRTAQGRLSAAAVQALSADAQRSSALRAAALAAARLGRYRDAAALLFASAVRALDERGRLRYDPARTPGEYRRLVRDPVFDALAADAVVAVFASAEPRDELFVRMVRAYDRFFDRPAQ